MLSFLPCFAGLVRDLEAPQDSPLFRPLTLSTTASEVGLFVVQLELKVATQVPVEADAPGLSHPGGVGRIGEDGESLFVYVQFTVAGRDFKRAPSALR